MLSMTVVTAEGKKVVVLGLTVAALERVKSGECLEIKHPDVGVRMVLYVGESDDAMLESVVKAGILPKAATFIVTYDEHGGALAITCLICRTTSYNPNDITHRYCPACSSFQRSPWLARARYSWPRASGIFQRLLRRSLRR